MRRRRRRWRSSRHSIVARVLNNNRMISLLHYFSHSANWVPSSDNIHGEDRKNEKGKWMTELIWRLTNVFFFFFDHHTQTNVMNVDCTRKVTLFLSSTFASSFFLVDMMHTHTQSLSLLFLFHYRVQYPFFSSISVLCICLYLFVQSSFKVRFCSSLAVTCSLTMSSLLNIIMNKAWWE